MEGFVLVTKSTKTPTHRTIIEETILEANPPLTSRGGNAELLDVTPRLLCGTDDATRGLDLQVIVGLSYGFSFLRGDSVFPHHVQGSTPLDDVHPVPRLHDRFGFGCVWLYCARMHTLFYLVQLCVGFPRFASSLLFLVLCPIFIRILYIGRIWLSFLPLAFWYDITIGVRILEMSDLHVTG